MKFDPKDNFVKKKGFLPPDIGESCVSDYLGTFHVYKAVDEKDKKEDVLRDLLPLGLSDHEMKFAMFRLELHTKYHCKPLVTPRTLHQTGEHCHAS